MATKGKSVRTLLAVLLTMALITGLSLLIVQRVSLEQSSQHAARAESRQDAVFPVETQESRTRMTPVAAESVSFTPATAAATAPAPTPKAALSAAAELQVMQDTVSEPFAEKALSRSTALEMGIEAFKASALAKWEEQIVQQEAAEAEQAEALAEEDESYEVYDDADSETQETYTESDVSYEETYTESASDYTVEATYYEPEPESEPEPEPETTSREAYTSDSSGGYSDLDYLAAICQIEAGSNYDGCLAVANVVLNRVYAGYASSVYGVIYAPYQFATGDMSYYLENGTSATARQAAADALAGVNNVGGYLSFNGTYWLDPDTLSVPYTVIGGNVFY